MCERSIIFQINSHPIQVAMVGIAVRACCKLFMNETIANDMELAVVEALNNVIEHTYKDEPGGAIQVHLVLSDQEFLAQIRDYGSHWELQKQSAIPDFGEDLADMPEGGFGLFIIEQLMDQIELSPEDSGNTLTLKKQLPPREPDNEAP